MKTNTFEKTIFGLNLLCVALYIFGGGFDSVDSSITLRYFEHYWKFYFFLCLFIPFRFETEYWTIKGINVSIALFSLLNYLFGSIFDG